jgi:uncharacterized protein YjiS (DUF1127 family)
MSAVLTLTRKPVTLSASGWLVRISSALTVWEQRRKLAVMDDHQLADLGLDRAQALAEANRPLWDVPATWRN